MELGFNRQVILPVLSNIIGIVAVHCLWLR